MVIIGLTFICTMLFNFVEQVLLWLTIHVCCRKDRHLYRLIKRQMDGHAARNNKTSIMLTLSVSFLFFAASSFELLNAILVKSWDKFIGADIYVVSSDSMLTEGPLTAYLED